MTVEVKGGGSSELSQDINVITAEINAYQRVAGEAIFEIGRRLKHVRDDMKYGRWSEWCREELGMTRHSANRFLRVYERFSNGTPVYRLPNAISILDALVPFSDEELEKPRKLPDGSTKKLTEMSRREIEEFKKREREAVKEKEKALLAAEEADKRAKQAEAQAELSQRSEENMRRQLEEFESGTPEVEIRTEYVEVVKKDESLEHRLKEYEERFGAIENYSERPRATNLAEVTTSVMTFSKAVRDLAKRHAYLIQYQGTISALDAVTKREYNEAVQALADLTKDFGAVDEDSVIIDAKYVEQ